MDIEHARKVNNAAKMFGENPHTLCVDWLINQYEAMRAAIQENFMHTEYEAVKSHDAGPPEIVSLTGIRVWSECIFCGNRFTADGHKGNCIVLSCK